MRMLIDTHTHIYLPEFDSDRHEMMERALEKGIEKCFMPNIDLESIPAMLKMEEDFPGRAIAMMGLHPCSVKDDFLKVLNKMEKYIESREWSGIGECGLDLYWDKTSLKNQMEALNIQLSWAKQMNKPIILHTREATDETIKMVELAQDGSLKGIFHCFGGTIEQANRIKDLGFHLGIGGVLTYKKSGLDAVLSQIGLDKVVLETDAPYLPPVPYRGKRNEPSYLFQVAQQLSEMFLLSIDEVARKTTLNAKEVFDF